ncbi:hypothetical protein JW926_12100 [Candidatus Sumerlaeota bacterium]|nr:hypothetical protein [Candidatus Sumerlaeota bacterium]
MSLPSIDESNRKRPLCYDPKRKKFILYDDIISKKEEIIPVESLSDPDLKKLIIERQLTAPDYKAQAISGPPFSKKDVIKAIEQDDPFGKITLEAEKSYLRDFLDEIRRNLK